MQHNLIFLAVLGLLAFGLHPKWVHSGDYNQQTREEIEKKVNHLSSKVKKHEEVVKQLRNEPLAIKNGNKEEIQKNGNKRVGKIYRNKRWNGSRKP